MHRDASSTVGALPSGRMCTGQATLGGASEPRHADAARDKQSILRNRTYRRTIATSSSYTDVSRPHVVDSANVLVPRSSTR